MWKCEQCGEEMEDQFDSCWKCAKEESPQEASGPRLPMKCLRCQADLEYEGSRHFHEGAWTDFILHREHVDVYICPKCGHMELFAAELGKSQIWNRRIPDRNQKRLAPFTYCRSRWDPR